MKILVTLVAAAEAATGVLLLAQPAIAARFLLGTGLDASGAVMGRIAGVCLIALGISCWPGSAADLRQAARGLLAYSVLVALVLAFAGGTGGTTGPLLWPAVALHGVLTILLLRTLAARAST